VKRRNASIDQAWVIQDLTQWLKEKKMPVPQGELTTADIWSSPDAINNQTIEETQENNPTGETNATEQAVVQSGSETEE
jgi:hypothetical protein